MIRLHAPRGVLSAMFRLPVSKSLVNRQLILAAIRGRMPDLTAPELPEDVRVLGHCLTDPGLDWDAGAGGTTWRFLTAFLALSGRTGRVTGSLRMQERPVAPLMEALATLGVAFRYEGRPGFPPVRLEGFTPTGVREISMDPSGSSQFLTAVLLASPLLGRDLDIRLAGQVTSRPYLDMTLRILRHWGVDVDETPVGLSVRRSVLQDPGPVLEADWSAASYGYALLALSPAGSRLVFPDLRLSGFQGDEAMAGWMTGFGIRSLDTGDGIEAVRETEMLPDRLDLDLTGQPDLAQTLAVLCAVTGVPARFSGLHTLRIKETDRTAALAMELEKAGVTFRPETETGHTWVLDGRAVPLREPVETFGDHRMAMAFSLMALVGPCFIRDPQVVEKSFPMFWESLKTAGYKAEIHE